MFLPENKLKLVEFEFFVHKNSTKSDTAENNFRLKRKIGKIEVVFFLVFLKMEKVPP